MMTSPSIADVLAHAKAQQQAAPRLCRPPRTDSRLWTYRFEHAQSQKPVYLHFLPGHTNDPMPIKSVLSHHISVKRGWSYRQPCPSPMTCPVCRYRVEHPDFYITGDRQRYASVVVIVDDPLAPREPYPCIYEYGREIHQLLIDELESGANPFDINNDWSLFQVYATWTVK